MSLELTEQQITQAINVTRERFEARHFVDAGRTDKNVQGSLARIALGTGKERMRRALGAASYSQLRVARAVLVFVRAEEHLTCLPWVIAPEAWPIGAHRNIVYECAAELQVRADDLTHANDPDFPLPTGVGGFAAIGPSGRRALMGENLGALPSSHADAIVQLSQTMPDVSFLMAATTVDAKGKPVAWARDLALIAQMS